MLVNLLVNETPKPSIIVLHMLARSAVGDARLINNVGDLGGVCPLPIEQLECLRGTEMVSIVRSFCVYCTLQYSSNIVILLLLSEFFSYALCRVYTISLVQNIPRENVLQSFLVIGYSYDLSYSY